MTLVAFQKKEKCNETQNWEKIIFLNEKRSDSGLTRSRRLKTKNNNFSKKKFLSFLRLTGKINNSKNSKKKKKERREIIEVIFFHKTFLF